MSKKKKKKNSESELCNELNFIECKEQENIKKKLVKSIFLILFYIICFIITIVYFSNLCKDIQNISNYSERVIATYRGAAEKSEPLTFSGSVGYRTKMTPIYDYEYGGSKYTINAKSTYNNLVLYITSGDKVICLNKDKPENAIFYPDIVGHTLIFLISLILIIWSILGLHRDLANLKDLQKSLSDWKNSVIELRDYYCKERSVENG